MTLVQLLLPITGDRNIATSKLELTRTELLEQFGGVTAYLRSPAKGLWADAGAVAADEVVNVEVVVDEFDRAWWEQYERTLAERFAQQEIHVRAIGAELIRGGNAAT
jgi:hypothetical protein